MEFEFRKIDRSECESLERARAGYWRAKLTMDDYCERSRVLDQHPYGKSSIDKFAIRSKGSKIWASACDALLIEIIVDGKIHRCRHIARVATLPTHFKQGFASRMMRDVGDYYKDIWLRLDSDINPSFYEKFGFKHRPVNALEITVHKNITDLVVHEFQKYLIPEFVEKWRLHRSIEAQKLNSACVLVTEDLLDWHLERFRFFASKVGKTIDESRVFRIYEHQNEKHFACWVPDYPEQALQALVLQENCHECRKLVLHETQLLGLKTVRWWSNSSCEGAVTVPRSPMLRAPLGKLVSCKLNSVYLDYW